MLEQTSVTAYGHLINGEIIDSATGGGIDVLDPSTGKVFARIPRGGAAEVDRAVDAARSAFEGEWGAKSALERGRILMKISALILENFEELTALESRDTGKPMKQARADITATARYFEYYGSAADKHHGETIPYSKGMTVLALRVPHGVTAHIIPWNYPSQIFGRSVGGALAAVGLGQTLERTEEGDGLYRRHLLVEAALLGEETDPVANLAAIVGTQDLDPARGDRLKAQDHAQRRGLARSVGAQEAADAAGGHLKAEIAHGLKGPIAFAHAVQRQGCRHPIPRYRAIRLASAPEVANCIRRKVHTFGGSTLTSKVRPMNFDGFKASPLRRTSKCRCGPVEKPVEPTRPTRSPPATA